VDPHSTVRLAVSRATRSPTFYEVKGDKAWFVEGPPASEVLIAVPSDLDPEVNTSVELGYIGQWPEWGGQLDVRLYREHLTDYIGDRSTSVTYPKPGGGTFKFKYFTNHNSGAVDVTGLDMHLVWKPHRDFSLHLGQAFINIDASRKALDVDNDLPESGPDWITSILANWQLAQGLNLSSALYRTDKMFWLRDGDETQAYTRVDVRLAKQFKFNGVDAEWALGVQNLGEEYEEFRRQNVFTQRAYGSLTFAW
jgi:iron complex outermembrane receptor protein